MLRWLFVSADSVQQQIVACSSSIEDGAGGTIAYLWGTIERINVINDIRIR
jgi:hypothetical protein